MRLSFREIHNNLIQGTIWVIKSLLQWLSDLSGWPREHIDSAIWPDESNIILKLLGIALIFYILDFADISWKFGDSILRHHEVRNPLFTIDSKFLRILENASFLFNSRLSSFPKSSGFDCLFRPPYKPCPPPGNCFLHLVHKVCQNRLSLV